MPSRSEGYLVACICPCFSALFPGLTLPAAMPPQCDVATTQSLEDPTFFCQCDKCFYDIRGKEDYDIGHVSRQEEALGSQKCSDVTGVSLGDPWRICLETSSGPSFQGGTCSPPPHAQPVTRQGICFAPGLQVANSALGRLTHPAMLCCVRSGCAPRPQQRVHRKGLSPHTRPLSLWDVLTHVGIYSR
jgi:hypothetical protein